MVIEQNEGAVIRIGFVMLASMKARHNPSPADSVLREMAEGTRRATMTAITSIHPAIWAYDCFAANTGTRWTMADSPCRPANNDAPVF